MTAQTDPSVWPVSEEDEDVETEALLDTARFTSSGPPPISRPSRWAVFLKDLEDRALNESIKEDKATIGPFDKPDQAYSVSSRITRGKFPGSGPAGKFDATSRTQKKRDAEGNVVFDRAGEPIKHTMVWVKVNPDYLANPKDFHTNGDSAE